MSKDLDGALKKVIENIKKSQERHLKLRKDSELNNHVGLVIDLDLTILLEQFQAEEMEDMYAK